MSGSNQPVVTGLPAVQGNPQAGLPLTDLQVVQPFATINVANPAGGPDNAVIVLTDPNGTPTDANGTLSGAGLARTGTGTYALTAASAPALTAALQGVTFTPTAREVPPDTTVTTEAVLSVASATAVAPPVSTTLNVTATSTGATAGGVPATETAAAGTPVALYGGAVIADADNTPRASAVIVQTDASGNRTDAAGTLAGTGLTETQPGLYTMGTTDPATLQAELRGVAFTPSARADGSVVNFDLEIVDGYAAPRTIGSNGLVPPYQTATSVTVTAPSGQGGTAPKTGAPPPQATPQSLVTGLYEGVLGRAPDQAGLTSWSNALSTGQETLQQEAAGFLQSAEYQARYGAPDTATFLTELYRNVLGRAPDAQGEASWANALNSGGVSRADVAAAFAQSPEFQALLASHNGTA